MTVDAILEATERLLVAQGYHQVTTNDVAELAGVSIGSLYQYYPSVESLAAALYLRMKGEIADAVAACLLEAEGLETQEALALLPAAVLDTLASRARLHAILAGEAATIGRKARPETERIVETVTAFLDARGVESAESSARLLISALLASTEEAVRTRPDTLEDPVLVGRLQGLVRGLMGG